MHWTLLTPFMIEDISNPIGAEGICQERLASSSGAAAALTAVSWQRHQLHDREDTISQAEKLHRRGTHKMGVYKKEKQSTKYIIALYKMHYKFCFYSIFRTVCFTKGIISWQLLRVKRICRLQDMRKRSMYVKMLYELPTGSSLKWNVSNSMSWVFPVIATTCLEYILLELDCAIIQ